MKDNTDRRAVKKGERMNAEVKRRWVGGCSWVRSTRKEEEEIWKLEVPPLSSHSLHAGTTKQVLASCRANNCHPSAWVGSDFLLGKKEVMQGYLTLSQISSGNLLER